MINILFQNKCCPYYKINLIKYMKNGRITIRLKIKVTFIRNIDRKNNKYYIEKLNIIFFKCDIYFEIDVVNFTYE